MFGSKWCCNVMMREHLFKVAGFVFGITLPMDKEVEQLLPSFLPFRYKQDGSTKLLFSLNVTSDILGDEDSSCVVEQTENDMGQTILKRTSFGYRLELRYKDNAPMHVIHADPNFSEVKANVRWDDVYAGSALCSLIRIAYSQAILSHKAVSVHASAVVWQGKAFLFMGKSGTGKSTHSALWRECFQGCELLNDDNPTLRIEDNIVVAYGTPWSGKTPCYRNASFPVAGIVRLKQAKENRYYPQEDVAAFTALVPGCFAIHSDTILYNTLCDNLVDIAERVHVGLLACLPDHDAARLCACSVAGFNELR